MSSDTFAAGIEAAALIVEGYRQNGPSNWQTMVEKIRRLTPTDTDTAIPAGEVHGWKCNNCQTVFTSPQLERKEGDTNGGPSCPYCKAHGQYTYRYPLHQGDPCSGCGVAHDDVPRGPCVLAASPKPDTDTPVDPGVEGVREALADFCRAAEYSAGCDEGVLPDAASSEIMSWAGSWMASAYDKAVHILAAKPIAGMDAGEVGDA